MSIMKSFEFIHAASVDQAVTGLDPKAGDGVAQPRKVHLKAGGVDLIDLCKEHLVEPKRIINIRDIPGLDQIQDDGSGGLKIGPLVTLARLDADPAVRGKFPILADAAGHAATPQIRNMATLGGNLLQRPRCWYFRNEEFHCRKKGGERCFAQDGENQYHAIFNNQLCAIVHPSATATPLVTLGASFRLKSPAGERVVPAEKFFTLPQDGLHHENVLAPDELLTEILIPAPAAGSKSAYVRQGEKESFDWPVAEVAVVLQMDGETCKKASIVLGAASPAPRRATEAEKALAGKPLDESTATAAAHAALKDAHPMTQNAYKLPIFQTLIRRTILAAAH
jgi:xanthine dehydrogenase YagS FAD-binding subunit